HTKPVGHVWPGLPQPPIWPPLMHCELMHVVPLGQARPQPPQFLLSCEVSIDMQLGPQQMPYWPPSREHHTPSLPRTPFTPTGRGTWEQSATRTAQLAKPPLSATQVPGGAQATSQPPQWFVSLGRQVPLQQTPLVPQGVDSPVHGPPDVPDEVDEVDDMDE